MDLKPENMEDLSEVITVAEFHPHHCHLLAFSSSAGATRLCDMRSRALCDRPAKRESLSLILLNMLHSLAEKHTDIRLEVLQKQQSSSECLQLSRYKSSAQRSSEAIINVNVLGENIYITFKLLYAFKIFFKTINIHTCII